MVSEFFLLYLIMLIIISQQRNTWSYSPVCASDLLPQHDALQADHSAIAESIPFTAATAQAPTKIHNIHPIHHLFTNTPLRICSYRHAVAYTIEIVLSKVTSDVNKYVLLYQLFLMCISFSFWKRLQSESYITSVMTWLLESSWVLSCSDEWEHYRGAWACRHGYGLYRTNMTKMIDVGLKARSF